MLEDENFYSPPFLSSSLERILRTYEEADCILFEPVTLSKQNSGNSSNFQSRKSGKIPVHTAKLHSNPQKPLPSLAEDEDTLFLRSQVFELEHQSLDLTVQIQLMQQKIDELEKELTSFTTQNVSNYPQNNQFAPHSPKKPKKVGPSPALSRGHQITPRRMAPKNMAEFYKDKYEKVKAQYEGLTKVLSQHGQFPSKVPIGNARHVVRH
ncbi:hypothetical protein TRFO_38592 [Tritrichomonas foetus]|uniref:Uncharacterized protein n=1 Tax=Tritrichomonas foetus TaxID=1144522 RepID=A0A1J4J9H0_9EUKA|nr:hypothetical protein TRFO_38592 [Tritrichomonas foetus]|eukprot:OHS95305.1 hypothetical protein TRFO_38592 [Tritrichomonas foetus]